MVGETKRSIEKKFTVPLDIQIRTTRRKDLPLLEWFGWFTRHRGIINDTFDRQQNGEALMLVAIANDFPIGQVWVDLARKQHEQAGILWALRVLPPLQKRGIGSRLLAAAESALASRGYQWAELHVEKDNVIAIRLYRHAGYEFLNEEGISYTYTTPDGLDEAEHLDTVVMRKPLNPEAPKEPDLMASEPALQHF